MVKRSMRIAFLAALVGLSCSYAGTINLGVISFNTLILGAPGSPGVNSFSISNLTGDPATGGWALPPDFPAFTGVTFLNSSLTVGRGGSTQVVNLGDIGPGSATPASLQFPDTDAISWVTFSAYLSQQNLLLADGSGFQAASTAISVTLSPSSGSVLSADTDFALIAVTDIPEPASLVLVSGSLILLLALRRRS